MATILNTKKDFLEWLGKQIEDDEIIVISQDFEGSMTLVKKRNVKKVTFGFAADAFKRKDDIGHFAFDKTPLCAFSICKKEDLSPESLELLKNEKG